MLHSSLWLFLHAYFKICWRASKILCHKFAIAGLVRNACFYFWQSAIVRKLMNERDVVSRYSTTACFREAERSVMQPLASVNNSIGFRTHHLLFNGEALSPGRSSQCHQDVEELARCCALMLGTFICVHVNILKASWRRASMHRCLTKRIAVV